MTAVTQFDAIVIGSGITGGWAAKELTQRGLKVLMLDRGRMVEHGRDYKGEHMAPWDIPFAGKPLRELYKSDYFVQSDNYAFDETSRAFWNNDRKNPYLHDAEQFSWKRADVVGGKSLLWARQCYRWSEQDFAANKLDGHGNDWPIRYRDLESWYSYVEEFSGISGEALGLPQLPDSVFQPPMTLNVAEKRLQQSLADNYDDRLLTIGRVAVQTEAKNGRGACHYCGPCFRGCSVGAYFSTQSSTLPAAQKTGNLSLRADSVVQGIDYDPQTRRATGVRVIDANTMERTTYTGKLIFLCASTIASNQILLNSGSDAFPRGLANSSGVLGEYLMDHTIGTGAFGVLPGDMDTYWYGNRPNGAYIPRFRNLEGQDEDANFVRGYGYQGMGLRMDWKMMSGMIPGFGAQFKQALRAPGPWAMYIGGFGECLPYKRNRVLVDNKQPDRFGIAQVKMEFAFGDNEENMRLDIKNQAEQMLKSAGASMVHGFVHNSVGGEAIHEMGGARMGNDPAESVLNQWNQAHDVANLFVTDGAAFSSVSCVNPSLTFMALTARAADYAVKQLQQGNV